MQWIRYRTLWVARCWLFIKCMFHQSTDPHTEFLLLRKCIFRQFPDTPEDMTTSIAVLSHIARLKEQRKDCERVVDLLVTEVEKLRADLTKARADLDKWTDNFEPF